MQTHIDRLKAGEIVRFRPHGNSMVPRIHSGQLVTLAPIAPEDVQVGDAVLCKVHGRKFLHLVTAIKGDQVQISNNHGHVNGWTTRKHVYGKLVGIDP